MRKTKIFTTLIFISSQGHACLSSPKNIYMIFATNKTKNSLALCLESFGTAIKGCVFIGG